jgi:hypothetical protein
MSDVRRHDGELRAVLRELAAADAPELIESARRRARARVERILEDELVEELLVALASARTSHPAAHAPEPEPLQSTPPQTAAAAGPEQGQAWWTYCILWEQDAASAAFALEGVEPDTAVEAICDGDLAALVSPVPLAEYGDESLRAHLEDLAWVERTARRHEEVLEAALREATIVPLRLCTLYHHRDGVRRLLREQRSALKEGLGRVDGCLEWGIKLFSDPQSAPPQENGPDAGEGGRGATYLLRRQQERALAEKAAEVRARCAEVVHDRVAALARSATTNPPQRPEVHGRALTMLLNGAYLIERDRTAELREAVAALQDEWAALGFTIELTGPWPPYNFVSGAAGVLS